MTRSRNGASTTRGLSRRQRVWTLSGGQQAQVALTLALAKRPQLRPLDEPVASLDPLARREFLTGVLQAVTETGITVRPLLAHRGRSSARCDQLVILGNGCTQLVGPIEEILACHRLLTGPRTMLPPRRASQVTVRATRSGKRRCSCV